MAFHGEVSPRQAPAPSELPDDVGLQASRCEERGLHGEGLEPLARAGVGVDEDRPAVGPRGIARIAASDLHRPAGEGRGQQAKPPEAVASGSVTLQGFPIPSMLRATTRISRLCASSSARLPDSTDTLRVSQCRAAKWKTVIAPIRLMK